MQEMPVNFGVLGAVVGAVVIGVTLLSLVLVVVVVRRVFGGLSRASAQRERLLREGTPAPATIVNLGMGRMTMQVGVHRHLEVQLLVQVEPPDRSPWQATLATMISELQVPQLQPGARIQVRYDPRDPSQLALEGIALPGAVPGLGAPAAGGAPLMAPAPAPRMPLVAKIGLALGLLGGLVGVVVAVLVTGVFSFGLGHGTGKTDSNCDRAIRCCRLVAGDDKTNPACANLGLPGVPDSVCSQALDTFQKAAASKDLVCE